MHLKYLGSYLGCLLKDRQPVDIKIHEICGENIRTISNTLKIKYV